MAHGYWYRYSKKPSGHQPKLGFLHFLGIDTRRLGEEGGRLRRPSPSDITDRFNGQ